MTARDLLLCAIAALDRGDIPEARVNALVALAAMVPELGCSLAAIVDRCKAEQERQSGARGRN